ncbi:ABC transporter ATP-binding protein [Geobacter sp. DSM 9736]|uniref:ABC transporter ATP-binding protein n=1 Tax=Geobacter sp. DSM 9736 TaxID=1277350 RepID=UPI000B500D34|nr:ABC transporter ATP-binding protein [Geobacter sp. DSM 9736]SNB46827.1 amino acid/amide ABC transporter ATP-binding protein 2, HAAT family [Geobacter sp. DSM 9736]
MLRLTDVHLSYGHVQALRGVSMEVAAGEIVTLIGANGAGKSSTLKAISGMHAVSSGNIELEQARIDGVPPHEIVGRGISHCPEGRRIFYDLSVRENLMMGGYLLSKHEMAERLEYVLDLFPRMRERIGQAGGTLSGGEQQMLAIARALMCKPRLLMLDEPSLGLAPLMVEKIFETVLDLKKSASLTILLVEQNACAALEISDRGYVLETGRVILQGESAALRSDERVVKAYLGG